MSLFNETLNPILSVECQICFYPLTDKEYLAFNVCDHKFHTECLNNWQKSTKSELILHYKCPTCDTLRDINIERSLFQIEVQVPRISLIQKLKGCITNLVK